MTRIQRFLPFLAAGLLVALALPTGVGAQVKTVDKIKFPELRQTEIPKPTRVELSNGMIVMFLEDHELPLIDVSARIRTGSRLEPRDKVGLATLTGGVMRTGGTDSMNGDELDDFLEGRAASIETGIGTSSGSASMSCLKADFAEVLAVFSDVLRNPVFAEEKIKVAKTQMEAGISRQNDQPQGIIFREFSEIIYGGDSPYTWNPTYDSVANIAQEDLIAWHANYFHPNRFILGIAGDFDTAEAKKLVEQVFGDWEKGPEVADVSAPYNQEVKAGLHYVEKNDVNQSNILMGHLGIKQDNPDYYAVEVMNEVFGGGFAARLFSNVRSKKGLAYTVRGSVGSNWDYAGTFSMYTTTKKETTAAAIDALIEEARNMTALPPSDEEVEKAKAGILNSFVFNYDSTREILGQQLTYEYYGFPLDWLQRYNEGVRNVTTEQVRQAAVDYIHPDNFAILVVGPSEGVDRPLSSFGEVALVDISIPEPSVAAVAMTTDSLAKGRELIAMAVKGMGGGERVDSVVRFTQSGSLALQTPQGAMDIKVSMLVDLPDRVRQEMVLPFGKVTSVVTPEAGFTEMPQGTQQMSEAQRQESLQDMLRDPIVLLRYRDEPEFQANAVGAGEVSGTLVENVQIEFGGITGTYGIDVKSGQILRMVFRGKHPMTQAPGELVRTFSDFRDVSGVLFPFEMSTTFNGDPMVSGTLDSMIVDGPLDETAFAMPAGDAAEAGGR